jgi:hypothetical protein
MRPPIRHRAAGVVLAALFSAAPLLVAAPAFGGLVLTEATESGQQVTFSGGGLLGVSCAARPDVRSVTVDADSTLRVVNRTGYNARLMLDGETQGEVADDGSAQVLFRRGPVTLSMRPSCVLSEESRTVEVQVRAATPTPEPSPEPSPSVESPSVQPTGPSPSGEPAAPAGAAAGGLPDAGAAASRRTAAPGLPDKTAAGSTARASGRAGSGGGSTALAVPGMPPGDSPRLGPGSAPADGPAGGPGSSGVAAEPVAALEPVTETGPVGLLAIMATICVAGVTAGAIRAIASQRASRTKMA